MPRAHLWLVCSPLCPGIVSVHLKKDSLGNLTLIASPGLGQPDSCGRLDSAGGDPAVTLWHKCKRTASASSEHGLVKWSHTQVTKTFKDR